MPLSTTISLDLYPSCVVCDILGSWIDSNAFIRVVTSTCNSSLFEMLRSKEFVFNNSIDITSDNILKLLLARRIKVSNVYIGESDAMNNFFSDYMRFSGKFMRSVHSCSFGEPHLYLIALYCKKIEILACSSTGATQGIREILLNNPKIQEIWLDDVSFRSNEIFHGVKLDRLHSLSTKTCDIADDFTWDECFSNFGKTLQRLEISQSGSEMFDFIKLCTRCPLLRSINVPFDEDTLDENLITRPDIVNINFSSENSLSQDNVCNVLRALPGLHSINVQERIVTSAFIRHLADSFGSTLERLYLWIAFPQDPNMVKALELLGEKCPKLTYLDIDCGNNELCAAGGTFALMKGLPALHTLVVNKLDTICLASRQFIQLLRPQLKIIVRADLTKPSYDVMTLPV